MDLIEKKKEEVRELCGKALQAERSFLSLAIRAGEALLELKDITPRGEFMPLVKSLGVGQRQANRYMTAARLFITRGDDLENLPDVSINEYVGLKSTRAVSGKFVAGNPGGPGRGHQSDDAKDESDGKQYIYVICNPLIPEWVKVGMSDNPCRRAKEMQTYAPEDYFVVYQAELPDGFRDTTIHPFLSSNFDSNREWFRCPSDDAIDIIKYHLDGLTDERFAA